MKEASSRAVCVLLIAFVIFSNYLEMVQAHRRTSIFGRLLTEVNANDKDCTHQQMQAGANWISYPFY